MKLKNIPNILSAIRIMLVGVFVYTFFCVSPYVALVVFLLAGATDVVDGYLARRNNWISDLGKILDPFADKLMQCTVLVSLYIKKMIPIWFVIPFFLKEITSLIMGLIVIKKRNIVIVSKWYGKMTVCLFYATIVLSVFISDILRENLLLAVIVFMPAVVSAIITFVAYVKHYAVLKNKNYAEKIKTEEKADAVDAAENI
ncbi:MAG: CDP-alcohol phosphatidyltransferase family protein [Ruminococcaceae bacterium]|nr:CDP-alcohol phosphatidyltransferase family protein [Oscillospiraceae bacterium]